MPLPALPAACAWLHGEALRYLAAVAIAVCGGKCAYDRRCKEDAPEQDASPGRFSDRDRSSTVDSFYSAVSQLDTDDSPERKTSLAVRMSRRLLEHPKRPGCLGGERRNMGAALDPGAPIVPSEKELHQIKEIRDKAKAHKLADGVGERWYEECEMLRYLRARSKVSDSLAMFKEAMELRCKYVRSWEMDVAETGSFGSEYASYVERSKRGDSGLPAWWSFLRAHLPLNLYGQDRNGLPVAYFSLGGADLEGLQREVGIEHVQQYGVMISDYFLDLARSASEEDGILLGGIVIVDLEGLSGMWTTKTKVKICGRIAAGARYLHPERNRRSIIVRAPRGFSMVWNIITTMIEKKTADRTTIISVSDSLQPLFHELGAENVPDFLGGQNKELTQLSRTLLQKGSFSRYQAE